MANLAISSWALGDVDRATSLVDRTHARINDVMDVNTHAYGKMHACMFQLMRGDHARATPDALKITRLAHEHDMDLWRAFGLFLEGWATSQSGEPAQGLADMRRGAELLRAQNVLVFDGLVENCTGEGRGPGGRSGPRASDPRSSTD